VRNGNAKPPPVHWKYRILPHASPGFIEEFKPCEHLIVVGITNDKIADAFLEELRPPAKRTSAFGNLKRLDVYYADHALFDYMPSNERPIDNPDAVQGNSDRSKVVLADEAKGSIKKFCELRRSGNPELNLYKYAISPIAGIVAGDVENEDRGVIQVTHYIWGRTTGSCPTMVLRRRELKEVYDIYANYLHALGEYSEPLNCPTTRTLNSRKASPTPSSSTAK
jgi:hypothetical protein